MSLKIGRVVGFKSPQAGQSLTESVILMPVFLLALFTLIQVGHLGIGVAIVNYAASSVAHLAVQENTYNQSSASSRFKSLLIAGLKLVEIQGKVEPDDVTPNVKVTACASLQAYPFVGEFLDKALGSASTGGDGCGGTKMFGPVSLQAPAPYHFIIRGQTMARMNLNPNG